MESPPLDEGIVVYQARHGLLCHHAHDQLIGRSLRLYGEWAEEEIYLLSSLIPSGGVVLDLGANIGTHALAFGRRVGPDGYVLAIDAQEEAFRLLVLNLFERPRAGPLSPCGSRPGEQPSIPPRGPEMGRLESRDLKFFFA